MTLTRHIGEFVTAAAFDGLPPRSLEIAKLGFIDCLAVMIAGSSEDVVRILTATLPVDAAPGEASLYLSGRKALAVTAALINGTAAHALDYDDTSPAGHRSAVLVPAILAEGEAIGATGAAMLGAYVMGFEVWSELVRREPGQLHDRGWHPTGAYGAVAAAAAVANLRRLGPIEACHAIGIGASQSGGLVANFGAMTKPFHAGKAAAAGVLSARLAANGMTASETVLEHKQGFLSAVSQSGRPDRDSPSQLGFEWRIVEDGLSVKKYPVCYCTHRVIDAILDIRAAHRFEAADIVEIEARIGETQAVVLEHHRPTTALAAKFSVEFALACAVLNEDVSLAHLTDAEVSRPDVQKLMAKIRIVTIPERDPALPGYSPYDQVQVRLSSGDVLLSDRVMRARGHISAPLSEADLRKKFDICLAFGNSDLDPEPTFRLLQTLEHLPAGWTASLPRLAPEILPDAGGGSMRPPFTERALKMEEAVRAYRCGGE
jgi:2-methylcitrate dehydratase PrpD